MAKTPPVKAGVQAKQPAAKASVLIDASMHTRLKERAAREQKPLGQLVEELLSKAE